MQYICIIFSVFIAFSGYMKEKNIYNPLTIFFSVLGVILFLASLQLYGLYEVSQYTYTIIFTGLFSFFIGYCFIELLKSKVRHTSNTKSIDFFKYEIRYKTIYVICIITIIFLSYNTFQAIGALMQGYTLPEIRSNNYGVGLPEWYILINQYVIRPMVFAIIPLGVIDLFKGKKKLLIPTFTIIVLTAFGHGGRFIFYYFLVQCVIAAFIFKKRLDLSRKMKLSIIAIATVSISIVFSITNLRGVSNSFFQHIYVYIAGAIPHLDYRINILDDTQLYTYGLTFFRGFLTTIFLFLNGIGILGYPEFYNRAITLANVENQVQIGSETTFNAFVTPFFYFYLDGGLIGVILSSFFYAVILALSYYFVKNRLNILNMAIYLLLMQGVFTSMVRWQFTTPAYALAFIYVAFLIKKTPPKVYDNKLDVRK